MKDSKYKKIAIIGSGFVGQATGKGLAAKGHDVVFYDVKPEVISSLNESGHMARHIGSLSGGEKKEIDIFILSVPTPTINMRIELKYLKGALKDVGKAIGKMNGIPLVVVRSTVPPGTTEKSAIPILEKASGKKYRQGFVVSMQPEFLREVSAEKDFANPWIVVIGSDDDLAGKALGKIYEPFGAPIFYTSLKEAEMMKYAHNLLNATKISFFNEMRMVGEKIGADSEVIFPIVVKSAESIWNPNYGIKNFGPYSGSCLPKDTEAFFTWAKETLGFEMPVLKGTILTNELLKAELKTVEVAKEKKFKKESRSSAYGMLPAIKRAFLSRELPQKSVHRQGKLPRTPLKNL